MDMYIVSYIITDYWVTDMCEIMYLQISQEYFFERELSPPNKISHLTDIMEELCEVLVFHTCMFCRINLPTSGVYGYICV